MTLGIAGDNIIMTIMLKPEKLEGEGATWIYIDRIIERTYSVWG